jgi:DNA-binding NarL/FixJ family response regulator
MIRVALADDQPLIRAGLRSLLDAESDVAVVGEAGTGRDAVALPARERPEVVLMDIRMPDGDGLWATESIAADPALSGTRVVIVTTFELDEYVAAMSTEQVLGERYARGEIDESEYRQRLDVLRQNAPQPRK